tara:strand:+ start:1014 stop:1301 length:288 start_codon:yes stop_codon:yes gene_type:complete
MNRLFAVLEHVLGGFLGFSIIDGFLYYLPFVNYLESGYRVLLIIFVAIFSFLAYKERIKIIKLKRENEEIKTKIYREKLHREEFKTEAEKLLNND